MPSCVQAAQYPILKYETKFVPAWLNQQAQYSPTDFKYFSLTPFQELNDGQVETSPDVTGPLQ